jgi:predicted DNA-binding transcriptional regulator AlpA
MEMIRTSASEAFRPPLGNPSSQLLTSWKEIANFLGKGVRTAQRWERELHLPVHRPANGKHVVWAVSAELEAWIAQPGPIATGATCCDCKAHLDRTNAQIAALLQENAELRRMLNITSPKV